MQTNSSRKKYIDLLRLLALFYMFFQHGVLMLLQERFNTGIILFLDELVPICGALFLFLSGYSLTLSHTHHNTSILIFLRRVLLRGGVLIGSSSVLFFIMYGLQLPDLFFSSSILNTIGWLIIIGGFLLFLPVKFRIIVTGVIIVCLTLLLIFWNANKIFVFPFNNGYEPMVPTIIFGFVGFLVGILENSLKNKQAKVIFIAFIGGIGLSIFMVYAIKYPIFKVFYYDIGRYTITRTFNTNLLPMNLFSHSHGTRLFYEPVWNYLPKSFFASLGVVLMMFSGGFFIENFMQKYFTKGLFIPGEFAFVNYFYHLFAIAIMVLIFGYNYLSVTAFVIFLIVLFIGSYFLSFATKRIKQIRRKSKT